MSPQVVEREFGGDVDGLAELFPRYRSELARRGIVDFDEQIYRCLEVLLTEPDVRRHAQRRCQVLLVDEFQDLTPAHMLLLRLLAGPTLSIFGVGDDDQTIYGYTGATPRWLVDFDAFVPASRHHALTVNYRCPAPVVTAATRLLSRNRFRVRKQIAPGPGAVTDPGSLRVLLEGSPTTATVAAVRRLLDEGVAPSEIAVLTRVNALLAPVHAALVEGAVPVQLWDGSGFLNRTGVAAALAWLRLAVAPARLARSDLALAARRPSRGISPRVVDWIGEQSEVSGIERLAERLTDDKTAEKLRGFAADLRHAAQRAETATTSALLEFAVAEIGLARSMQSLDEAHIGRNGSAHSDDLRALIALGEVHPEPSTFPGWLARVLGAPGSTEGVTLATVHRVKGLEWRHVVVHDVTSGLFPHRLSTDIEEERRVFHVAITRGIGSVTLVADKESPSMFLDELTTEQADLPEPPASSARHAAPTIDAAQGLELPLGWLRVLGAGRRAPARHGQDRHVHGHDPVRLGGERGRAIPRPRGAPEGTGEIDRRRRGDRPPRGVRGAQGLAARAVAQGRRAGLRRRVGQDAVGALRGDAIDRGGAPRRAGHRRHEGRALR